MAGLSFCGAGGEGPCPAAHPGGRVEIIAIFKSGLFCQNRPSRAWRSPSFQPSRPVLKSLRFPIGFVLPNPGLALKSLRLSDRVCSAKIAARRRDICFIAARRGLALESLRFSSWVRFSIWSIMPAAGSIHRGRHDSPPGTRPSRALIFPRPAFAKLKSAQLVGTPRRC
jgi:hypothetical protein